MANTYRDNEKEAFMNKVNSVKIGLRIVCKILILFVVLFILIPLIFYYGLKIFFYYENQNYYNTFNQECIEIVSDYVIQNYGDCYTIINSEELYGEAGIFGESLCGIKYTFKDLNEVTNDTFYVTIERGADGYVIVNDSYK